MTTCEYKFGDWNCDNEALSDDKCCFWHLKTISKMPTVEQLQELRGNVIGVYLRGAKLQGADLIYAHLQEADLQGADLTNANLLEANLRLAKLQEADLINADLQEADLRLAKLQKSNLLGANLQKAILPEANLQEANLRFANLQEAKLQKANLQEADLHDANLRGANVSLTDFQGANLSMTMFNSETNLTNSNLTGSNLYQSYFDLAKSFRNIEEYFKNKGDKEINEIVGDTLKSNNLLRISCKFPFINKLNILGIKILKIKTLPLNFKPIILNYTNIERNTPKIASKLHGKGMFRYAGMGDKLIFFDIYRESIIKNPENGKNCEFEKVPELTDFIIKDGLFQQDYLFQGKTDFYYEASYEVYNNLYNFYSANSRLDKAAEVHYSPSSPL